MKNYITFDGGGNKLKVVVYSENLEIVGYGKSGGVNDNFYTREQVRANVHEAVTAALSSAGDPQVESAYGIMVGPGDLIAPELEPRGVRMHFIGEGHGCLMASMLSERGVISLSGTGATIYAADDRTGKSGYNGGCGAPIGDEGSGYYIGEHGIRAALQDQNGWGKPTLLKKLLAEYTGSRGDEADVGWFYDRRGLPLHRKVADFTRQVEAACNAGDEAALDIVKEAGRCMALQTAALVKRLSLAQDLPVATCGGGWKTSPVMVDAFRECFGAIYPDMPVVAPLLEPVCAGAVLRLMENGELEAKRDLLLTNFAGL